MKCTLGIVSQPLDAFTIFFTPAKSKIRNMNDTVIQITLWLSILLKRGALSISFYRLMNVTSDMNWGDFVDCEMNVLFLVFAWIRFCHRRLNLLASGERLRMFFFFLFVVWQRHCNSLIGCCLFRQPLAVASQQTQI